MRKIYLVIFLYLAPLLMLSATTSAQIVVTPNQTAAILATKLVGPGVTMFNPVLTCAGVANGTFIGTSSLSFDSGIILCSGMSTQAVGNAGAIFASTGNGTPGDPQLTALAGVLTYDACVLQFDFRPAGDTIKFDYVFGSEEYPGFTCSPFNDVFGFFVNGPGIAGIRNIALVPGTNIPVSVNSVNCGPSAGYTIGMCNAMGPGAPFCAYYINNAAGTTIAYDGITTTLTAIQAVTPCDTYHLKLAIADGSDDILDSGVFLKAGSLTSNSFSISALGINPNDTGFGSQYCIRGCAPGMFIFHNTGSLTDSIIIKFAISGSGVNGTDYTWIPDSTIIHSGHAFDTVFIHGLTSASGTRTVKLLIYAPFNCNGVPSIIDSIQLSIYDSFYLHINTPDTTICIGQDVLINTSGSNALNYSWTPSATLNSSTLQSPTATPIVTTTYVVTAGMAISGCPPSTAHITITVVSPPVLNVGPPIQDACLQVPKQIGVTATPAGPYNYSWTPTTYLNNATIANPIVTPGVVGDQEYYVTVSSPVAFCNSVDSFLLHTVPNDFSLFNPDSGICFKDLSSYQVRATGDTEFTYTWSPTAGVSNPHIINPVITPPGITTTYYITATYPACPDMVHHVMYSIENPRVNILVQDTTFCIGLPVQIPVQVTPTDSPYTFTWSSSNLLNSDTLIQPSFFSPIPGDFSYTLIIKSGLGCADTDNITLHPTPPIRVAVNPAISTIKYGDHIQLDAINLSTYPLIYYWEPNDGSLDNPNINNPVATPRDSTTYTVYAMNAYGCKDTETVIINVDKSMGECIPSAFTPNGDGLNDVFRLCSMTYQRLVEFSVFNRWGQMVYHNTTDATKGWDGTWNGVPQDMGVYNYLVIIARVDGTNLVYKGEVTLIR